MNETTPGDEAAGMAPDLGGAIGDVVALGIQELYCDSKIDTREALLKIDNREEAAKAPFQFDPAAGLLHRRGCKAIPESARTALYGVWRISPVEIRLACPRCKPAASLEKVGSKKVGSEKFGAEKAKVGPPHALKDADKGAKLPPQSDAVDLVYGVLSILHQFGSVLRERGREFRKGGDSAQVASQLEGLYAKLDEREKGLVTITLNSLDQITRTIRDFDQRLNGGGTPKSNAANGAPARGPEQSARNGDRREGDGQELAGRNGRKPGA